jgi:peptidoglycan hydrolase-like protein with peptidoglycan-binding domain
MKTVLLLMAAFLIFASSLFAQGSSAATNSAATSASTSSTKKSAVFRPTKDQITKVQKILKDKKLYTGDATGKYDDATRNGIKSFQKDNGLKETGTLNRATLEKFGVELTDAQKAIPVSANSFASTDEKSTKPKASSEKTSSNKTIFRATADQVKAAQKVLKDKSMYTGEQNGKLDDATRDGLKKYQEANGLKVTGTLNQTTLEKMGIGLTDKQKGETSSSATTTQK